MWAEYEATGGDRPQVGALVEATELTLDGALDFRQPDASLVPVRSQLSCSLLHGDQLSFCNVPRCEHPDDTVCRAGHAAVHI